MVLAEISDDELRRAAAKLLTELTAAQTRTSAMAELASAPAVRRGNMAGFVLPAIEDEHLLDGVFPKHGFVWLVLACSPEELEDALRLA